MWIVSVSVVCYFTSEGGLRDLANATNITIIINTKAPVEMPTIVQVLILEHDVGGILN